MHGIPLIQSKSDLISEHISIPLSCLVKQPVLGVNAELLTVLLDLPGKVSPRILVVHGGECQEMLLALAGDDRYGIYPA